MQIDDFGLRETIDKVFADYRSHLVIGDISV